MDAKGIDLTLMMTVTLIITFLTLYGPFSLLFFLPVPFYLLFLILFHFIPFTPLNPVLKTTPRIHVIRGPPPPKFSN